MRSMRKCCHSPAQTSNPAHLAAVLSSLRPELPIQTAASTANSVLKITYQEKESSRSRNQRGLARCPCGVCLNGDFWPKANLSRLDAPGRTEVRPFSLGKTHWVFPRRSNPRDGTPGDPSDIYGSIKIAKPARMRDSASPASPWRVCCSVVGPISIRAQMPLVGS